MSTQYLNSNQTYYQESSSNNLFGSPYFDYNNSPLINPLDILEHQVVSYLNLSKYSQNDESDFEEVNPIFNIDIEQQDKDNTNIQMIEEPSNVQNQFNQMDQENSHDHNTNEDFINSIFASEKHRSNTGSSTNLQNLQDDSFQALQREANQKLAMMRQETNVLNSQNLNENNQIIPNNNHGTHNIVQEVENMLEETLFENDSGFYPSNQYNNFMNNQSNIQSQSILDELHPNNYYANNQENQMQVHYSHPQSYNQNQINPQYFDYQEVQKIQTIHHFTQQDQHFKEGCLVKNYNNNNQYDINNQGYLKSELTNNNLMDEQFNNQSHQQFEIQDNFNAESFDRFEEENAIIQEKNNQHQIENYAQNKQYVKQETEELQKYQSEMFEKQGLELLKDYNQDDYIYFGIIDLEEEFKSKLKNQFSNSSVPQLYNFVNGYYQARLEKNISQDSKYLQSNQQNLQQNNLNESNIHISNNYQQSFRNQFGSFQALQPGENIILDSRHSIQKLSSNELQLAANYQNSSDFNNQQLQQYSQTSSFSKPIQQLNNFIIQENQPASEQNFTGESTEKKIFDEIMKLTPKINLQNKPPNQIIYNRKKDQLTRNLFSSEKPIFESSKKSDTKQDQCEETDDYPFRKFPIALELIDHLNSQYIIITQKQEKLRNRLQIQKHFGFYSMSLLYSFISFIESIPYEVEQSFLSADLDDQEKLNKQKQLVEQENEKVIEITLKKLQNSRKILALSAKVIPVLLQKYQQPCQNILFYAALLIETFYNQRTSFYDGCIDKTNYQTVVLNLYNLMMNQPIFYQVPIDSKCLEYLIHNIIIVLIGYLNNLDHQFTSTLII